MKGVLLIISVVFLSLNLTAQDEGKGIVIQKDTRLEALLLKNKEVNEAAYVRSLKNVQGFRIQIVNTNDRKKAMDIKTELMSAHPEEESYFLYQAPYFKVQIGNFRTREQAEPLLDKLKRKYEDGLFIVPSRIEVKATQGGEIVF